MKFCIPVTQGRGAGLGNEILVWAKAYLASVELGIHLLHPAWGLNPRGYRRYFGTSRFDWILPRLIDGLLPSFSFGTTEYRATGETDLARAVRAYARAEGLDRRLTYALRIEGMWGGYPAIRDAKPFILSQLYRSRRYLANLHTVRRQIRPGALVVAVHVRLDDFGAAPAVSSYPGRFNLSIPLDWYISVCRDLRRAFRGDVQFILLSDGRPDQLAPFIAEFSPMLTVDLPDRAISDLLVMTWADLIVCSISSYSLLGAFLSEGAYLWFEPQLQRHDRFLSIWGHEDDQRHPDGPTMRNIASLERDRGHRCGRGFAARLDGRLPAALIECLTLRAGMRDERTDLLMYGVVESRQRR
jgi:hypothetical protein